MSIITFLHRGPDGDQLLFQMLEEMDHLAGPKNPIAQEVWVGVLAAPLILEKASALSLKVRVRTGALARLNLWLEDP